MMRTFGWNPSEGELHVNKNSGNCGLYASKYSLLQELIGEVDQDGNGCITFNEFVWLMTRF